ncbi:hypothetical protein [Kineococcus sp. SYSU DK004]|uniref:hypothetical protein n=1 Tax=Kineococcus sp. SYSU DK004 TaxID=3383125 RepID=UPI003D7E0019
MTRPPVEPVGDDRASRSSPASGKAPGPDALRHVRWLGGGSGAGKSTTARRLAARYGLRRYGTDESMADHVRRCPPQRCPALHAFAAMDRDERWVHRGPEVMLETFGWFRGEAFDLLVDDLLALPADRPVLVEGLRVLPDLVAPLLSGARQAVWLLPTPRFRRAAFTSRGGLWDIAGRTSDPPRALANLLERDRLFTDRLRGDVARLELGSVEVDVGLGEDELEERVAAALGLPDAATG